MYAMPRRVRLFALAAALAITPTLVAPVVAQEPSRIEQQMTPEQFKAAGLDRLSAEQLANLNAWLNRTLTAETARVEELTKNRFQQENRGFLNFGSNEPIVAHINGSFSGFGKGRSWTLDNGQIWRQTDNATLVGVKRVDPLVKITPSIAGNSWYLAIDGYNTRAQVIRIK